MTPFQLFVPPSLDASRDLATLTFDLGGDKVTIIIVLVNRLTGYFHGANFGLLRLGHNNVLDLPMVFVVPR